MRFDRNYTIVRDGKDIEVSVEFDATPHIAATWFDPAEGGEIEILAVFDGAVAIDPPLTEAEESRLLDYLYESMDDSDFDVDDDRDWDAERDRQIDDRLTDRG